MNINDKLLVNLKIISKIQKNGKISRSSNGVISLETDKYYQSVKRFFFNDSRYQAVFEISSIISECIDTFESNLNSKFLDFNLYNSFEFSKVVENIQLLLSQLVLSKSGIQNLKFTYKNDHNISSQLDVILLKIDSTIRDVSNKLSLLVPNNKLSNSVPNDSTILQMNDVNCL